MKDSKKVYLDYAATTPVDPRVLNVMLPYFAQSFGNPSSIHTYGQSTEAALISARESLALTINCEPNEVIFTSCGTESDNLALRGTSFFARKFLGANHILITPVEHHAVKNTAIQLEEIFGFEVEMLPVDKYGVVNPKDVADHIRSDTAIVSVIYANNEIGSINPISEIGAVCKERGVPFHTDAVQGAAYLTADVKALNVDMMAIGAHKFYGPKGIGALYVREGLSLIPIITGGGQENHRRSGTENIPYIVGMAEAFSLAQIEREDRVAHMVVLRDRLVDQVLKDIPDSKLTGHPTRRLPNHASFVFQGIDGNELLMMLDIEGFACSSGSACKTGDPEPSEVLSAIGLSRDWALGSLRVTVGKDTQTRDMDSFIDTLKICLESLRKFS